jgi:hypothetical protein
MAIFPARATGRKGEEDVSGVVGDADAMAMVMVAVVDADVERRVAWCGSIGWITIK